MLYIYLSVYFFLLFQIHPTHSARNLAETGDAVGVNVRSFQAQWDKIYEGKGGWS